MLFFPSTLKIEAIKGRRLRSADYVKGKVLEHEGKLQKAKELI